MKKTLIIIGGATATGKTKTAINLALKFKSEIISVDSRQFYKELNIGVAKPSPIELKTIPHHFIGHKSIKNSYSIGEYEKDSLILLNKLFKKHDILFLCGGSGLYIDSVCEGLNKFPEIKTSIKERIHYDLATTGLKSLVEELKLIDKETYQKIDRQNPRRIIRALEVYRSSGKPYSFYTKQKNKKRNFNTLFIALKQPRKTLYNNINNRVDLMIKNGLMNEVQTVYKYKNYPALQTIGYQELFQYFDKKKSLEETINEIKKNTRRYAKRQITWFKNNKYFQFESNEEKNIIKLISKLT